MAKGKRLKRYRQSIKGFLYPLKSDGYTPNLELTHREQAMIGHTIPFSPIFGDSDEEVRRRNTQKIDMARLEQDKDAINKNLSAQHRLVIATLILAMVAVLSTVVAIIIALYTKPVVVKLEVPNEQKTIQTTN